MYMCPWLQDLILTVGQFVYNTSGHLRLTFPLNHGYTRPCMYLWYTQKLVVILILLLMRSCVILLPDNVNATVSSTVKHKKKQIFSHNINKFMYCTRPSYKLLKEVSEVNLKITLRIPSMLCVHQYSVLFIPKKNAWNCYTFIIKQFQPSCREINFCVFYWHRYVTCFHSQKQHATIDFSRAVVP